MSNVKIRICYLGFGPQDSGESDGRIELKDKGMGDSMGPTSRNWTHYSTVLDYMAY